MEDSGCRPLKLLLDTETVGHWRGVRGLRRRAYASWCLLKFCSGAASVGLDLAEEIYNILLCPCCSWLPERTTWYLNKKSLHLCAREQDWDDCLAAPLCICQLFNCCDQDSPKSPFCHMQHPFNVHKVYGSNFMQLCHSWLSLVPWASAAMFFCHSWASLRLCTGDRLIITKHLLCSNQCSSLISRVY